VPGHSTTIIPTCIGISKSSVRLTGFLLNNLTGVYGIVFLRTKSTTYCIFQIKTDTYRISARLEYPYYRLGWNSRFADLNNDQWQDLFISNGHTTFSLETSNILYLNEQGKAFVNATTEAGLEDFTPTLSNLYIDYDNDGDLDILTFSQTGKLTLYRNNENTNSSIQIELADLNGNFYGIGSRVYIYYQDGEISGQMRDIHLSGGYMSHNEPIAHFGLGNKQQIQRIEVLWPDKTHSVYTGPFKAGKRYQIIRKKE